MKKALKEEHAHRYWLLGRRVASVFLRLFGHQNPHENEKEEGLDLREDLGDIERTGENN